jgi:hypothetical protein
LTELERWHGWKHPFIITPFVSGEPSVTFIHYFELPSLRPANAYRPSSLSYLISGFSHAIPSFSFHLVWSHLLRLMSSHPILFCSSHVIFSISTSIILLYHLLHDTLKLSTTNPLYHAVFFPPDLCLYPCHSRCQFHEHHW